MRLLGTVAPDWVASFSKDLTCLLSSLVITKDRVVLGRGRKLRDWRQGIG